MHILHIYKDYFPVLGGIENHVRAAAEGLVAQGHRVTVLVTSTTSRSVIHRNGRLTIIKAARQLHLASTPLSWQMFRYARRLRGVDVAHLHCPYPPGDLVAQAVPHQPPLVVTYHSDIVRQQSMLRLYAPVLRHTLAHAARILPTSPAYIASSPWLQAHAERCTVVPLSIDVARFTTPPVALAAELRARYSLADLPPEQTENDAADEGRPLLLFVGRLRYYKGLHFLLHALPHIQQNARLLLVGTGPEEAALRQQTSDLGLAERVVFLGEVADAELPALYAAADVFVFPSHLRAEAFGIAQIEAQAAGLPIVCTELGTGTSYITQHGHTGFVVPPADPPALARAINVLLANPALARHLGAAGRQRASTHFSHQHMVAALEAVYAQVATANAPPQTT